MNGVFVKDLEMPNSCYDCPFNYDFQSCDAYPIVFGKHDGYDFCKERHPDCPLVNMRTLEISIQTDKETIHVIPIQ